MYISTIPAPTCEIPQDGLTAVWPHSYQSGCGCTDCAAYDNAGNGGPGIASAPQVGTLQEMADYLESGFFAPRQFNLGSTGTYAKNGVIHYKVDGTGGNWFGSTDNNGVSAGRAELIRDAFDLFEAVLGIDFVEKTGADTAGVEIMFTDNQSGAFAGPRQVSNGMVNAAIVNVAANWSGGTAGYDDYALQTIIHEIGHALGLGHQGPYNGGGNSFDSNSIFELDSWQASMMSYWSQNSNPNVAADFEFLQTPMAVDWLALDKIYGGYAGFGVQNAFTGDTVYGFNTNISASESRIWSQYADYADRTASTIIDAGGVDTLDFSGYGAAQRIDLTIQTAGQTYQDSSDIGGRDGNLTLAVGTVIENAIGGSGADQLIGNSADNVLTGNGGDDRLTGAAGDDMLYGGAGTDFAIFARDVATYTLSYTAEAFTIIGEGIDTVWADVENFLFDSAGFTWAELQAIAGGPVISPVTATGDAVTLAASEGAGGTGSGKSLMLHMFTTTAGSSVGNYANLTLTGAAQAFTFLDDDATLGGDDAQAERFTEADQRIVINGQEYRVQTDFSYIYTDGANSYRLAVVDVDLDGDGIGDSGEDTQYVVQLSGPTPPAGVALTRTGSIRNENAISYETSTTEDVDGNVLANDSGAAGATLSVSAVNGSAAGVGSFVAASNGGRVQVNADGSFDFDANGAFDGLAEGQTATTAIAYTVTDDNGATDTADLVITVTGEAAPSGPLPELVFYDFDPASLIGNGVGASLTYSGPATATGQVTALFDNEGGIQGQTLDDDSAGAESARADLTVDGLSSTNTPIDAEWVLTLQDSVTGARFEIAEFDVEQGAAAGDYLISEQALVSGRAYTVIARDTNPDVLTNDPVFTYADQDVLDFI